MLKKTCQLIVVFIITAIHVSAQSSFTAIILDKEKETPVEGAVLNIEGTQLAVYSDSTGRVTIAGVSSGEKTLVFSYLGYFKKKLKLVFPVSNPKPVEIKLEPQSEEIEEVVIVSTRANRKHEDDPMRVEVVATEDMEERLLDKPSSIAHAVKEQPGIQLQRTSASSGTFKIRLQGLNGEYVQLVKDGQPLFGGFSNALGIAQIPPMDLRQLELIKGPSSILYGGDAISGVINIISKEPDPNGTYDILFNVENTKSIDAGAYLSKQVKWFGFTLMGTYRYQKERDWNRDNFSDYPKFGRYNITPQLFFQLSPRARLNAGVTFTHENRLGGSMPYIQNKNDSVYTYFERNITDHAGTSFKFEYDLGEGGNLTVKNAVNYFKRNLFLPAYAFGGTQLATLSEVNYHFVKKQHDLVAGIDMRTDKFTEANAADSMNRTYSFITGGVFFQYIFKAGTNTSLSAGMRLDYNNRYGIFPLPQIAVLHKFNPYFSTRLNAGMGYKLPTVFRSYSEAVSFKNVLPISNNVKPELSAGGTLDLNAALPNFNGLSVSINQMFFYTHIFRPVMVKLQTIEHCTVDCEEVQYQNVPGFVESRGLETSLKISYRKFGITVNYTLADHNRKLNGVRSTGPLTSKHQFGILAGYELLGKFTISVDCYYFSPQKLSNGVATRGLWELGINTQLDLKYVLIFANLENVLDIRQSRYGDIVKPDPTFSHPEFAELYAPLEGTILNAGFKLRIGEILNRNTKQVKKDD